MLKVRRGIGIVVIAALLVILLVVIFLLVQHYFGGFYCGIQLGNSSLGGTCKVGT